MATPAAYPVRTLREHATAFEAALTVCLAEAKPKAVHKLRTETRRLEAQIALLRALPGLPQHRSEADKALRAIKKVRQAAGHVRDIDVQIDALEQYAADRTAAEPNAWTDPQHEADRQTMIDRRKERRDKVAGELLQVLRRRQAKVAAALEKLLSELEPALGLRVGSTELLKAVEQRFRSTEALARPHPTDDQLHTIRKAAKQARYLAETCASKSAKAFAEHYERLQESGGEWHDWLDLTAAASKEVGRKHAVTAEFDGLRRRKLGAYSALLEQFRGEAVGAPTRAAKKASAKPAKPTKETR